MSEPATPFVKQLVLPFAILSENRKEPFTTDIEAAALFCLAETERAKGGGIVMKQPEEKIAFITKVGYPLWLVPWNETVLVFDGLNRSSYALPYAGIPDVKPFMENLRRSSRTRETHLAFLRDHINYFQTSAAEKTLSIGGLIRNSEFLSELDTYRSEAMDPADQKLPAGLLTHILDESAISLELRDLENTHSSFQEDVGCLYRCMKFLNRATNHYIRVLRGKIKAVKDEFALRIKEEEERVAPRVELLRDDYDTRITDVARNFERQRLPIQKEKVKLERAKENAYERIEKYRLEAKTHAENDDRAGEQKWKEKSSKQKKELSEIEEHLKQTEKALKDLEERRSLEIFKYRDELEAKVKEARKTILELEASRDAKVLLYRQEMEKLEKQTKTISDLVGWNAKQRDANIAEFGKLGMRKELGFEGEALYYVPFCMVCYKTETKKRYLIVPPSFASSIGLTTKLKGVLGRARVKEILVPRFKVVSSLMDTLQLLAQQSAAFETEVRELGAKNNILNLESMGEEIKKGLGYLKNEGWLSEKEHEAMLQRL